MNNQVLAKVLFSNGLATKEQIQKYWALVSDTNDIATVLRDQGVLSAEVFLQVKAFVAQMDGVDAKLVPESVPPPPPPPPPAPPQESRAFGLGATAAKPISSTSGSAPTPTTNLESAVAEFAIEGNNPFGEGFHDEAKEEVDRIDGLQETRIFDFRPSISTPSTQVSEPKQIEPNPKSLIPPKDWILHHGVGDARLVAPLVPGPQSKLEGMLVFVRKYGISGMFVAAGNPISVQRGLAIQALGDQVCSQSDVRRFLSEALSFVPAALSLATDQNLKVGMAVPGAGRFRLTVTWTADGPFLAFHSIPMQTQNWKDLGIPDFCREWLGCRQGLILLGGTSGAGCTTTARCFASEALQVKNRLLQVVAEPVEFLLDQGLSICLEARLHGINKASLIRGCIERGDGILVIDKASDSEEIQLAMEAAECGHLVAMTVDGSDLVDMLCRILFLFEEKERSKIATLLARSIHGILHQKMLPGNDPSKPVVAFEGLTINRAISEFVRKQDFEQIRAFMPSMKRPATTLDESMRRNP